MTSSQKMHIAGLIKLYSLERSTESLISAVAETPGMLEVCKDVLRGVYSNRGGIRDWLRKECHSRQVELQLLLHELATVVELFQSEEGNDSRYAMLGVTSGATAETLKQAYRRLSKKYHPDTAVGAHREDPEKFIELTRIYQELLSELDTDQPSQPTWTGTYDSANNKGWRQTVRRQVQWPRKIYAWSLGVVVVVSIIFLVVSTIHRKRMMIVGLHQSRDSAVAMVQEVQDRSEPVKPVAEFEEKPAAAERVSETGRENSKENELLVEKKDTEDDIGHESSEAEPEALIQKSNDTGDRIRLLHLRPERRKTVLPVSLPVELDPPGAGASASHGGRDFGKSKQAASSGNGNGLPDKHWTYEDHVGRDLSLQNKSSGSRQVTRSGQQETASTFLNWKIDRFIDRYIEAYEQRDIDVFSSLYLGDARENGQLFSELHETYVNLFTVTTDLSLKLEETSAVATKNGVIFDGKFKVYWHYRNSEVMFGSGVLTMELEEVAGRLLIKAVDYRFDQ